jgi:hypothetical protein
VRQIPVMFETRVDEVRGVEATGIVHAFCTTECRDRYDGPDAASGTSYVEDFANDDLGCETCGAVL